VAPLVRPLVTDDEDALIPIDLVYARAYSVAIAVDPGQLAFYLRTGHAFVAEETGVLSGFILAHSIWDGRRPTVRVRRVVSSGEHPEVVAALLGAVTKSAYDSGVYNIELEIVPHDKTSMSVLTDQGFEKRPVVLYGRYLGSQGEV
jgi:hypothetical protein